MPGSKPALLNGFYRYLSIGVNRYIPSDLCRGLSTGGNNCHCACYCHTAILRTISSSCNSFRAKLCPEVIIHVGLGESLNGYIADSAACGSQIPHQRPTGLAVVDDHCHTQSDGSLFGNCCASCQHLEVIQILCLDCYGLCLRDGSGHLSSYIVGYDGHACPLLPRKPDFPVLW